MKLLQFGDFRVAAWARRVGNRWIGIFRIHRLGSHPTKNPPAPEEGRCAEVFNSREEALDAAAIEGVEALIPLLRERGPMPPP